MNNNLLRKVHLRKKRTLRVRRKLKGSEGKPRMCVVKSNKHLSIQLIDDEQRKTLLSLGTLSKEFKGTEFSKKSKSSAKKLGETIAQRAKEKGIDFVIFDRGKCKYHGIIAELANAAREAGLQF